MTPDQSELQINASNGDQLVTTQLVTRYGPISFCYAPKEIGLGISNLVRTSLRDTSEPDLTSIDWVISESTRKLLKKSAKVYLEQEAKQFPMDAIELFGQTARGYSQGTLEQFIDYLPAAMSLMMDLVAVAALTLCQTNESIPEHWTVEERRQMLKEILKDRLSDAS
jgi:hypothetical protein